MRCRLRSLLFICIASFYFEAHARADHAACARYTAQLHQFRQQGAFAEAERAAIAALRAAEESGQQDADLAKSWNNLGALYFDTGRYTEAESLFKRSADLWEKLAGPEQAEFAQGFNNLAVLYLRTSRLAEAESILARVLQVREKSLPPDHK